MRSKIFVLLLTATAWPAWALVDTVCQSDCTDSGKSFMYCQQKCSYSAEPDKKPGPAIEMQMPKQVDLQCQSDCLDAGSTFLFCQRKCEY